MIRTGHRFSKDIDAFIADPQYLSFLSPRLGGEGIWNCETFDEAANHLKLVYPEGEIDFIVAPAITDLQTERRIISPDESVPEGQPVSVDVEHPVETAIKKLVYRGSMLKVRDIFDIAVVNSIHPNTLRDNLGYVAPLKAPIIARLSAISPDFATQELAELDIAQGWRSFADGCLECVRAIASGIPNASPNPRPDPEQS
jgi:Nucleotidyl transferase AbiEii toxin, Type IV TA system